MESFAEEISFFGLGEDALLTLQEKEGYIQEDEDTALDDSASFREKVCEFCIF